MLKYSDRKQLREERNSLAYKPRSQPIIGKSVQELKAISPGIVDSQGTHFTASDIKQEPWDRMFDGWLQAYIPIHLYSSEQLV